MYRHVPSAPLSCLPPGRQGRPVGRFCKGCQSVYPLFAARHSGKPAFGKDHVATPCAHEGRLCDEGAAWWEPAVEILSAAS